jgi:uncharacterized damage-inducible protein DinB
MKMLERFLGHDLAATRAMLTLCLDLPAEKFDQDIDAGWRTLRKTFNHMISNIETWTDLMMSRPVQQHSGDSPAELLARLEASYADFAAFALKMEAENRLDELFTDVLDEPPVQKSIGGAIGHLITHSMHHRAEVLHIMHRLGMTDLPEGDLMGWDQQTRLTN